MKRLIIFVFAFCLSCFAQTNVRGNNGTFTGNVTVSGAVTAGRDQGVYGISNFGIKCDGVTDDSVGLNLIGSSMPATGWTVVFPPSVTCKHASSITTWMVPNLRVVGSNTYLKFTGTGKQIFLHSASPEVDNVQIEGFILQGNANSTHGLYLDTLLARSKLIINNIQDQNTACAYLANAQLLDQVWIKCSYLTAQQMGTTQTTVPPTGVQLGDTGAPFVSNRYVNLTIEQPNTETTGLYCKYCYENIFAGTAEGMANCVLVDPLSTTNTFIGFDTESCSTTDVVEKSHSDVWINTTSLGNFNPTSSFGLQVFGGRFKSITDDGGSVYANFHDLVFAYPSGVGSISGFANTNNQFVNVTNAATGVPFSNGSTPANFQMIRVGSLNGNAAARLWCWVPDGTGNGYFELWQSTASNSISCFTGAAVMQFQSPNGIVAFPTYTLQLDEKSSVTGTASKANIVGDSGDHMLKYNENNAGEQHVPQIYTLTAQYTNSTTGFTTVGTPNIAFPVKANTNYTATCHLYYQAAATGGLNIQFTGPAAPTAVHYGLNEPLSATAWNNQTAAAFSTSIGAVVTTATTDFDAIVSFTLVNGVNAGTVTLQAKSSAAVQLQIQIGSYCVVQ